MCGLNPPSILNDAQWRAAARKKGRGRLISGGGEGERKKAKCRYDNYFGVPHKNQNKKVLK